MDVYDIKKHFGSAAAAAKALGFTTTVPLSQWENSGNGVPLYRQWQLELGTDGAIKADVRPLDEGWKDEAEMAAWRKEMYKRAGKPGRKVSDDD